jgi:hypothetical protein
MKIRVALVSALLGLIVCSAAYSSPACDVLEAGNKLKDASKSLAAYKAIEDIDKLGKDPCTGSVYATMATIYKMMGDKARTDGNPENAMIYYKLSSQYNRAFAYAVLCHNGECEMAKTFWAEKFWSE